jgi:hypothetical protein
MIKKVFYLALTLFFLSAASMKAQVLIGDDDQPDPSAVLELRSTSLGLLLPQVKVNATDDDKSALAAPPVDGLLVCNAEGDLPHGVYYWRNGEWVLYIKF